MTIFIDGDSCSRRIREIVRDRCQKESIKLLVCSNRPLPESRLSPEAYLVVSQGTVDEHLLAQAIKDDWVLTRDLPLAKALLAKGVGVFNDRGREFSLIDIDHRLRERDLMLALRQSGGGPPKVKSFGPKEVKAFATFFDQLIQRVKS
jgi:uncharacterized protein YaiI (UPF0178 family)